MLGLGARGRGGRGRGTMGGAEGGNVAAPRLLSTILRPATQFAYQWAEALRLQLEIDGEIIL